MARYFFQDESLDKFETPVNVVILSAERALTQGGCSTAGYLLKVLVEARAGALLTLEVFAKSQGAMNHYLRSPLSYFPNNVIRVGDETRLWGRQEYARVTEIAA